MKPRSPSSRCRFVLALLVSLTSATASLAQESAAPAAAAPVQRLEDLGVELVGVRLSGADFLIDVRYRVKDVAKAQALMERKVHPVLVN